MKKFNILVLVSDLFLSFSSFADMDCSKLAGEYETYQKIAGECRPGDDCATTGKLRINKDGSFRQGFSDTVWSSSGLTCDPREGQITNNGYREKDAGHFNSEANVLLWYGMWLKKIK